MIICISRFSACILVLLFIRRSRMILLSIPMPVNASSESLTDYLTGFTTYELRIELVVGLKDL